MRFTIPSMFWNDHFERCQDHAGTRTIIKSGKRMTTVDLDREALNNLLSDCDSYADSRGWDDGVKPLCKSASTTLRILRSQSHD